MHNTTYLSIHAAVILFELPDPREAVLIRCKEMEFKVPNKMLHGYADLGRFSVGPKYD